ncbi:MULTISPECIES: ATP-binding protein [Planktothrix]|uniref:Transcriptional regulator n=1 Tax=Planktothrix rubescens CCAP 1459/22 TaxID=329571 RepID=A0A6J7ZMY1_PLARU|nr:MULTISPECIES: ATP-binding protein [Planktothrix]CAC5343917.1 Transcriptional regulator [Planktothrix rubescens NIVA-CYA 18]CAD5981867.1 Putative transcriptional regulator [Planktothrix rubescens NIVA-CYA 18]
MDDAELEKLLKDLESDRVERKASPSDRDKIRQAICAFANDLPNHQKPGVLFIGVNDDSSCANLAITDELLLKLSGMLGNFLPFPTMIVQKRTIAGCKLAVIIVEPSYAPPVRYNGRVWTRVGPSRCTASADDERRLSEKRRFRDLPFDIQPLSSASLDDFNLNLFQQEYLPASLPPDILEQNQRTTEQKLASVRFIHRLDPPIQPTNLGILVIGKEPRDFIPGAYIQFRRIEGTELTDPTKDQKELTGSISQILRQLDETLQINISVASDFITQPLEIKQPDYPLVALQQLTRNAVLHRTYESTNAPVRITWFSDRIEIQNPGGPFGQVTRQNFGQPGITDYRNPNLAEVLKNLGYVQRFGAGISIAQKELQKNGNPPPEFTVEESCILAVIRRHL